MVSLVSSAVLYVRYPIRFTNNDESAVTCYLAITVNIFAVNAIPYSITLYAAAAYVFIKYSLKKLKRHAIIIAIVMSWGWCLISSVVMGSNIRVEEDNGFCSASNGTTISTVDTIFSTINGMILFTSGGIVVTFDILIFRYAKKNIADESIKAKKSILKLLAYHTTSMLINILQ